MIAPWVAQLDAYFGVTWHQTYEHAKQAIGKLPEGARESGARSVIAALRLYTPVYPDDGWSLAQKELAAQRRKLIDSVLEELADGG